MVLYEGSRVRWTSKTNGKGSRRLVMQGDGNLVLYGKSDRVLWSSSTAGKSGATLTVQNDGNAVIYQGGRSHWARGR